MKKPLTHQDKIAAFKAATCSYSGAEARWKKRAETGSTDEDLLAALKEELGIAGGSTSCSGRPAIQYQGAGLRIWADWDWPSTFEVQPIFSGKSTMDMARYVYKISKPNDAQIEMF